MDPVLLGVAGIVSPNQHSFMDQCFTVEDERSVIGEMASLKAPGSDGFLLFFIRRIGR